MGPSFKTTFAVPMTCEACIKDVTHSLHALEGVDRVDANLKDQIVAVEGTAAPSAIVAAIQGTGRDAILRGSGAPNSAAVCILETHSTKAGENKVRGLARMIQVSPDLTLVDLTVRGVAPGTYWATIRERGDISRGAASTGGIWRRALTTTTTTTTAGGSMEKGSMEKEGIMGTVRVAAQSGLGSVFLEQRVQIWELVGRGMVVARQQQDGPFGRGDDDDADADDANVLVGVIARSAGVWENDKTVCSCSGKTMWDERRDLLNTATTTATTGSRSNL